MSRKYVNDRWCVRCSKTAPTPYLRDKFDVLFNDMKFDEIKVVDIGCGNCRNSSFCVSKGISDVNPMDMVGDHGTKVVLGEDDFPFDNESVDVILANYVFMFLNRVEAEKTLSEINRIAKAGARVMVELYAAKDSEAPDKETLIDLRKSMVSWFKWYGWTVVHEVQERFIMEKSFDITP